MGTSKVPLVTCSVLGVTPCLSLSHALGASNRYSEERSHALRVSNDASNVLASDGSVGPSHALRARLDNCSTGPSHALRARFTDSMVKLDLPMHSGTTWTMVRPAQEMHLTDTILSGPAWMMPPIRPSRETDREAGEQPGGRGEEQPITLERGVSNTSSRASNGSVDQPTRHRREHTPTLGNL